MYRQTVERFISALQEKDIETIADLLDKRMTVINPLSFTGDIKDEMRFEGKEESLGYFKSVATRMGRVRFADARISEVEDGSSVFFEATGDMTRADTGTPYRNVYVLKFEFDGERIVHITEYANPVTFATTFGFPLGLTDGSGTTDPTVSR